MTEDNRTALKPKPKSRKTKQNRQNKKSGTKKTGFFARRKKKEVYTSVMQQKTRFIFNPTSGASVRGDFEYDKWRYYFLWIIIVILMTCLVVRLMFLQVINAEFYQEKGNKLITAERIQHSYRGMIVDRNNQPLAISAPLATVYFSPRDFAMAYYSAKLRVQKNPDSEKYKKALENLDLQRLALAMNADLEKLKELTKINDLIDVSDSEAVKRALPKGKGSQYYPLLTKVSPEIANKIAALNIKGVYTKKFFRRYYPQSFSSTQLLGFMGESAESSKPGYRGRSGLELKFEDALAGEDGKILVLRDAIQTQLKEIKQLKPEVEGKNVQLTIDSRLQYLLYRELEKVGREQRALWSSGVVVDVETGEILAASTWPSYNANNLNAMTGESQRNRVFIDSFEPGSVMKPFTVAAALESRKYNVNTLINTSPGYIRVKGYVVRDHSNLGTISLKTLLKKSSNVGSTKIAWSLPADAITNMQRKFGLGQKTQIKFPGEVAGTIVTPKAKQEARRATLSYGYGMEVTLIQVAQAYAALGAGGVLRPVSIEKNTTPVEGTQVINKKNALSIIRMLESVTQKGGTAPKAAINGYRVAGKTGTSRRINPKGGYYEDKYRTVFAGVAPASKPRLAVAILVEDPQENHYAGQVAAPVFQGVMKEALRLYSVPFDKPLKK